MSKEEVKVLIAELKKQGIKNNSNKKNALRALMRAGLVDSKGKTTKQYCV